MTLFTKLTHIYDQSKTSKLNERPEFDFGEILKLSVESLIARLIKLVCWPILLRRRLLGWQSNRNWLAHVSTFYQRLWLLMFQLVQLKSRWGSWCWRCCGWCWIQEVWHCSNGNPWRLDYSGDTCCTLLWWLRFLS